MNLRKLFISVIMQEKEPENNDHNIKVKSAKKERNDLINPAWVEMEMFRGGELLQMNQEEDGFWKGFVEKYKLIFS